MGGAVWLIRYVLYSACLSAGSYLANSERSVPGRTWGSLFLFWFSSSSAVVWRGLAHRFISFRSCKAHNTQDVQLHLLLPFPFFFLFFFSFLFCWGGGGGSFWVLKPVFGHAMARKLENPCNMNVYMRAFYKIHCLCIRVYIYVCLGE